MTDRASEIPPEVAEALASLREAYARALPDKLAALSRTFARADEARTREPLEQLYREAHRLYGSAGAYGFAELAAALGRLEVAVFAIVEEGREADENWWRGARAEHAEIVARGAACAR